MMMNPIEMKVLMNHIYEYKKGVRQMVLFTCPKEYEEMATRRLSSQHIDYVCQSAGSHNVNLYFGRRECLNAIRLIVTRPLNQLTPEEDFILGAMLGYDLCAQCERYCERKERCCKHKEHCREHIEHCREHIEHCRDCSDPHCNHTLNMSS